MRGRDKCPTSAFPLSPANVGPVRCYGTGPHRFVSLKRPRAKYSHGLTDVASSVPKGGGILTQDGVHVAFPYGWAGEERPVGGGAGLGKGPRSSPSPR